MSRRARRLALARPLLVSHSRDGGIGRRAGLKIQFWQQSGGSIPPPGTELKNDGPKTGPFSLNLHSARGIALSTGGRCYLSAMVVTMVVTAVLLPSHSGDGGY